jgi:hypothetical protein
MKIGLIILGTLLIITLLLKCLRIKRRRKQTHTKKILPRISIHYNIDSKGKTLQEIQQERRQMQRLLIKSLEV